MYSAAKDDMIEKGHKTQHDAKDGARHVKHELRDAANTVIDDVEDMARSAGRHVRDLADQAGQNVTEVTDSLTAVIRDEPVKSAAIALGIGVVLGLLFRRS